MFTFADWYMTVVYS